MSTPRYGIDISVPYFDDRDGNKSRPCCVRIGWPNPDKKSKIKFTRITIVRSGSDQTAQLVHDFLVKELADEKNDYQDFVNIVQATVNGTRDLARRRSAEAEEIQASA